jgi:hypothetical protein
LFQSYGCAKITQIMAKEFERKQDRIIELAKTRRLVGNPSAPEIEAFLYTFPRLKSACKDAITMNEDAILEGFSRYKANISIPRFCASLLSMHVGNGFLETAEGHFVGDRIELFRSFHDLGVGSNLVLGGILAAENELSNLGEESRIFECQIEDYNFSATQEVEAYLLMKKLDREALGLLLKDKTGKLLIDDLVNKIRLGSLFQDMHQKGSVTKEYVVAGAELAGDLYKQVYGIIEQRGNK